MMGKVSYNTYFKSTKKKKNNEIMRRKLKVLIQFMMMNNIHSGMKTKVNVNTKLKTHRIS